MANIDVNALVIAAAVDENGSKKWMQYESDGGSTFAVLIDEHYGEALGFLDMPGGASAVPALPKSFKMREVHAKSANGKVSGSFPVGSPSTAIYTEGGTIKVARKGYATGLVLSVTGSTGERRRFVTGDDTGQDSGDIT